MDNDAVLSLLVVTNLKHVSDLITEFGLPERAVEVLTPIIWDHTQMRFQGMVPTTYIVVAPQMQIDAMVAERPGSGCPYRHGFYEHHFGFKYITQEFDTVHFCGTTNHMVKDRRIALTASESASAG